MEEDGKKSGETGGGESVSEMKVDLDTILINEIGPFGRYQVRTLLLALVGVVFCGFHADYLFTTARINTRCLIPECEDASQTEFAPPWLHHAIPATDGSFESCLRYGNQSAAVGTDDTCPATLFDTDTVVPCEQRVYEHTDTVVYDFDLGCDEWRRTLIGFARTLGTLPSLPLTGFVSDRWGRRPALVINCLNTAIMGVLRYWTSSYSAYTASQVIEAVIGAGVFPTTYILVLELVGPQYRVIAGGILTSFFTLGQVFLGFIAWAVPDWRALTLALYIPQFITVAYIWFISESVRWYMSKGRYTESEALLKEAARINKRQLSDRSLQFLRITTEEEKKRKEMAKLEKTTEPWLIVLVFRHKKILLRCVVVPVWWVSMTMVYYGLSVTAVNMSGNQYLNYVAVSAVEIPGFWLAVLAMSRLGRRTVVMFAFWLCAACQLTYIVIPSGMYGASLAVYLVGKCAVSSIVITLYVYTTEMFPTRHRHSLMAFCSMIGRIGSITAPLTPAFAASTFEEMPFVMFGSLALVSGCLALLMPETIATRLPDTMEQAERIGEKTQ